MSEQYGRSFADKLIADGRFDDAIAAADRAIALDGDDEGAWSERGQALYYQHRYAESVESFRRALALNQDGGVLDDDLLDDALYESVRAHAMAMHEAGESARAIDALGEYQRLLPAGRHVRDQQKWLDLFAGRAPKVVQRSSHC